MPRKRGQPHWRCSASSARRTRGPPATGGDGRSRPPTPPAESSSRSTSRTPSRSGLPATDSHGAAVCAPLSGVRGEVRGRIGDLARRGAFEPRDRIALARERQRKSAPRGSALECPARGGRSRPEISVNFGRGDEFHDPFWSILSQPHSGPIRVRQVSPGSPDRLPVGRMAGRGSRNRPKRPGATLLIRNRRAPALSGP
jgi:hypothetical protein